MDLEPNGTPINVPNQLENGKYNLISADLTKKFEVDLSVCTLDINELFFVYSQIELNLDCDCTFPIDLTPNRMPFGVKSIKKVNL